MVVYRSRRGTVIDTEVVAASTPNNHEQNQELHAEIKRLKEIIEQFSSKPQLGGKATYNISKSIVEFSNHIKSRLGELKSLAIEQQNDKILFHTEPLYQKYVDFTKIINEIPLTERNFAIELARSDTKIGRGQKQIKNVKQTVFYIDKSFFT